MLRAGSRGRVSGGPSRRSRRSKGRGRISPHFRKPQPPLPSPRHAPVVHLADVAPQFRGPHKRLAAALDGAGEGPLARVRAHVHDERALVGVRVAAALHVTRKRALPRVRTFMDHEVCLVRERLFAMLAGKRALPAMHDALVAKHCEVGSSRRYSWRYPTAWHTYDSHDVRK